MFKSPTRPQLGPPSLDFCMVDVRRSEVVRQQRSDDLSFNFPYDQVNWVACIFGNLAVSKSTPHEMWIYAVGSLKEVYSAICLAEAGVWV